MVVGVGGGEGGVPFLFGASLAIRIRLQANWAWLQWLVCIQTTIFFKRAACCRHLERNLLVIVIHKSMVVYYVKGALLNGPKG